MRVEIQGAWELEFQVCRAFRRSGLNHGSQLVGFKASLGPIVWGLGFMVLLKG